MIPWFDGWFLRPSTWFRIVADPLALTTLLLCIPSLHRNRTWVKLNAHHLGTRICWLLIDVCFWSSFTVHWRHWCRGKAGNSCGTFLPKPRRQNSGYPAQLWIQSLLSQTFFQFLDLFEARFLYFIALWWYILWGFAQLALFASHQYWHVKWAWLHVSHQTLKGKGLSWWLHLSQSMFISIQINNHMAGI